MYFTLTTFLFFCLIVYTLIILLVGNYTIGSAEKKYENIAKYLIDKHGYSLEQINSIHFNKSEQSKFKIFIFKHFLNMNAVVYYLSIIMLLFYIAHHIFGIVFLDLPKYETVNFVIDNKPLEVVDNNQNKINLKILSNEDPVPKSFIYKLLSDNSIHQYWINIATLAGLAFLLRDLKTKVNKQKKL
ncbi:hypothetical protein [Bacillus sp. FJAT-27245]|uniref:hypothetical protein n=1 Tax=Bacillus sp. FJAT-27245 TaxID=1684144 RepID=UPI0006A78703|nr:hypothetical protein [Bacillus sp. FJAT-27245]